MSESDEQEDPRETYIRGLARLMMFTGAPSDACEDFLAHREYGLALAVLERDVNGQDIESVGATIRREALARLICAELCGLVKDPLGQNLPDEMWLQALGRADAVLTLIKSR